MNANFIKLTPIKTAIIVMALLILMVAQGCGNAANGKRLEKNYGHAYGEVNIGSNSAQEFDADAVVPSRSELTDNLENAGFAVSEHDNVISFAYDADCVYAEKGKQFVYICYGLTIEQAAEVFASYEEIYEDYYVLAQNGPYVYVVSDEETFKTAGFESLETDGILFIRK